MHGHFCSFVSSCTFMLIYNDMQVPLSYIFQASHFIYPLRVVLFVLIRAERASFCYGGKKMLNQRRCLRNLC